MAWTKTGNIQGPAGTPAALYATTIGDGTTTSFTVTHNIGSLDVTVQLYATASPYGQVWATVEHTSTSTVTVIFASAPASGAYRVVVQGRAD